MSPTATERASASLREAGGLIQEGGTAIDQAVDSAVVATADTRGALPIAQLIDRTVITPFTAIMQGPPPNAGTAGIVRYGIDSIAGVAGVVMGAISLPGQILDTAVASLSSAIMPPGMGFPAACAGTTLQIGVPHTHLPPPSPPIPSVGDAVGPGCLMVLINGMPALRAGDVGLAPTCLSPGVFEIITGSASVFINGKRAARAMDMTRVCNPMAVFAAMAAASVTRVTSSASDRSSPIAVMSCAIAKSLILQNPPLVRWQEPLYNFSIRIICGRSATLPSSSIAVSAARIEASGAG